MDFLPLPPPPSSLLSFGNSIERAKHVLCSAASRILSVIFTFIFAWVGVLLGSMTGALLGQVTESGFARGAAVGAISGAVFSIEVFEASLVIWQSDETRIKCILYLVDVIGSLISGRLVREQIDPAIMSAVQTQMGTVESRFDEVGAVSIFDTSCDAKGLPADTVEKIPKMKITSRDNVDASGDRICCSVCLQDLQLGEVVRCLPRCDHMFHLSCIDRWLLRHGSCPLCRRELVSL